MQHAMMLRSSCQGCVPSSRMMYTKALQEGLPVRGLL